MEEEARQKQREQEMLFHHAEAVSLEFHPEDPLEQERPEQERKAEAVKPFVRDAAKVGRNDPCPCGSGKKYKQCHGKLD